MSKFKAFDGGKPFVEPEKPFMLVYESEENGLSIAWLETEEDMIETINEVKLYGCMIIVAIEIGSYRDIIVEQIGVIEWGNIWINVPLMRGM